jgi:hypothetical protein
MSHTSLPKNTPPASFQQRGNPGSHGGALFGGGDPAVIGFAVGPEINGRTVLETQTCHGAPRVTVCLEQVGGLTDDILDRGGGGEGMDTGNVLGSRNGHFNKQKSELSCIQVSVGCVGAGGGLSVL